MSLQTKQVADYYIKDKDFIKGRTEEHERVASALRELVYFRRYKDGDNWVTINGEKFFEKDGLVGSLFKDFVTRLRGLSQSPSHMFEMPSELTNQVGEEGNSLPSQVQGASQETNGKLKKLFSTTRRVSSSIASFLAPPPPPSSEGGNIVDPRDPEELFDKLRDEVEEGTATPSECLEILRSRVSKIIGDTCSGTFKETVDRMMEINRISSPVIKEVV